MARLLNSQKRSCSFSSLGYSCAHQHHNSYHVSQSTILTRNNAGPKPGHPARTCKSATRLFQAPNLPANSNQQQPHVHLLSSYRFPLLPQVHPDKVAEWLLSAPKISRDSSSFYWTYLDRPVDNTILLVWQSISLGADFPSDGYVWAPAETAFQVEVSGGYVS